MKQFKYLLFFLLFNSTLIRAQQPAHYVLGKEALAGLDLYSIIQDDYDYSIWITTENGVFNYNGKQFTHQIPENTKNTSLFGLIKDKNGVIYCYNFAGEIYRIVNKKLQLFFTIPSSLVKNKVEMYLDKNNHLIILSANKLFKLTDQKEIEFIEKEHVSFICKNDASIYYQVRKGSYFNIMEYKNNSVTLLVKDKLITPKNNLFFFKDNFYNLSGNKLISLKSSKEVFLPFSDKNYWVLRPRETNNILWVSHSRRGVYKIDDLNSSATIPLVFKNYYISGAMSDVEGNVWLLTFDKGIIFIPNTKIENLDNSITSISKSDKNIFTGNTDGVIHKLKNMRLTKYASIGKVIKNLTVFESGKLIFTDVNALHNNSQKDQIDFTRHVAFINDSILHLSTSNGLVKYNRYTLNKKRLTSKRTYSSYFDSLTKKIWLASSTGLQQLVKDSLYNVTYRKDHILARAIIPVKNEIWAASNKGIIIFKSDTVHRVISTKNGLLNNRVTKLVYEDPYVYIATRKGLQRYGLLNNKFNNFTQSNGLNGAVKDVEVLNDTTYLVTTNGLLKFTFNDLQSTNKTYNTNITGVYVNGTTLVENGVALQPDENNIEFTFLTPTFTHKNNVTYKYKLNGFEKEYTKARNNQNFVKFSNLPFGKYTFEIKSFINNKENVPAYFSFTVKPFWYKSTWFTIFIIFLGLFLIYYTYRYRLNVTMQKKDKEEMQRKLAESSLLSLKAQMNPHFMFNAINSIQNLILLKKRTEAYRYLTKLADFFRKNLNMSNVSFVLLKDEIELINEYLQLEKLRFKDNFQYEINNKINEEGVKIPSMIIQPFIENSVKHGLLHKRGIKKVAVCFTKKADLIICEIVDNGIGRKESERINKKRKFKSFSTNAIENRFAILRKYYNLDLGFSYDDLHEDGMPSGTRVIIKIITL